CSAIMRAIVQARRANARAAHEVTPSARAASQVRTHERDRICRTAPQHVGNYATICHLPFGTRSLHASRYDSFKDDGVEGQKHPEPRSGTDNKRPRVWGANR